MVFILLNIITANSIDISVLNVARENPNKLNVTSLQLIVFSFSTVYSKTTLQYLSTISRVSRILV